MKKKVEDIALVNEPMVAYGSVNYTPMVAMMGAQYTNPTDFDLLHLARKGISKKSLTALSKQISLTIEEVANVLHISERTLQRYTPSTLVKTEYADRAIELARLYERGIEVLGSTKAFNTWMRNPNRALNNEIPLYLLDTSIGFDMVLQILGRIEYGVFS
ncbi:MbcA/ParS/Xre antitoxin family protein [Pedobacter sp. MC2016-14]|uniref:type II RES/Xre toxin-antitoxin system antitoxin n=1 Tax=Pedobacter sp. MC2016-14 TaxID=2897327 RepID=UPI001E5564FB|nr:antitoxin Xre/MbcA/ParS toxin-binding domain-containing protein [Pedobacter sp. MC2016-14]MCD0488442.1 MbcA/ParS/Xre antitoxin family protein [Pedobacter sp. MC2016-14]